MFFIDWITINFNLVRIGSFFLSCGFAVITIVLILITVAIYTLAERKIMAAIQHRKGPNVVGIWGILQPAADGLKLVLKDKIVPKLANNFLFSLAPIFILTLSLCSWFFLGLVDTLYPDSISIWNFWVYFVWELQSRFINFEISTWFSTYLFFWFLFVIISDVYTYVDNWFILVIYVCKYLMIGFLVVLCQVYIVCSISNFVWVWSDIGFNYSSNTLEPNRLSDFFFWTLGFSELSVSILCILAISSFSVYSVILAGWSSNSKYAFLGGLRAAAQMISYEVSFGLTIMPALLVVGSTFNITKYILRLSIVGGYWNIYFLIPCCVIFFVSMLAETNRTPFDLSEAEAELVAGYNVEYSSIIFAMFFLAEYANMLLMSVLINVFFCSPKTPGGWACDLVIVSFLFVLLRATLPRYKYNDLMDIGWKSFLPLSLCFFIFISLVIVRFYGQVGISI